MSHLQPHQIAKFKHEHKTAAPKQAYRSHAERSDDFYGPSWQYDLSGYWWRPVDHLSEAEKKRNKNRAKRKARK